MELIDGKYVISDKELAWREKVVANTIGKTMMKHLDDQLAEAIRMGDEADEELWNS